MDLLLRSDNSQAASTFATSTINKMNNKTIPVTPRVINVDFIPAFRQLSQLPMPGKLAYALGKNMQNCMSVIKKCERDQARIIGQYAKLDELGRTIMKDTPTGPQLELLNEGSRELFNRLLEETMDVRYMVETHPFDQKFLESLPHFTPLVMVALSPFFIEEEVNDMAPMTPAMSVVKEEVPLTDNNQLSDDTTADRGSDPASNEDQANKLDLRVPAIE